MGYKINIYSGSSWINVLNHDNLENLQGGNGSDEYYHMTSDQHSWVDQDVTIGSEPSFLNTNMSGNISVWENDANYLVADDVQIEVHEQIVASDTWTVNHNYGTKYVMTQVFLDDDTLIYPTKVELLDDDNVELTFETAITGYVLYNTLAGASPSSAPAADHGSLTGLSGDDHSQYILVDGTRGFTGVVGGITPTLDSHLTTKLYVDNKTWVVADITDFDSAVSLNSDVAANTSHRTGDGSDHAFIDQDVTVGSSPQFSNVNMYGPVSQWTNDAGYIGSDTISSINADDSSPGSTLANDLWVEII